MLLSSLLLSIICFQEPTINSNMNVDYVVLDVTARDADGQLVTDLTMDNFILYENKKKMALDVFEIIDFRSADEGGPKPDPHNPDPLLQTLIMVLNLETANQASRDATFSQLQDLFTQLETWPAELQIFMFSLTRGVITQVFTASPQEAAAALTTFQQGLAPMANNMAGNSLTSLEAELAACLGQERVMVDENRGAGNVTSCLEAAHGQYLNRQTNHTRSVLGVMERFIGFMGRIDGLKSLYLISPGLALEPGHAANSLVQTYRSQDGSKGQSPFRSAGTGASFGTNPNEDNDFASLFARIPSTLTLPTRSLEVEFRRITQLAMSNRIILHTFGLAQNYAGDRKALTIAKALNVDSAYKSFSQELEQGLEHLARETGGRHYVTSNPGQDMLQTLKDHRFYYTLAYPVPNQKKLRKFRKIQVLCDRPGVVITHRSGYQLKEGFQK